MSLIEYAIYAPAVALVGLHFYNHQPLSFVYLVYNDIQFDQFATPFQEQQFVGKVTWMRQF